MNKLHFFIVALTTFSIIFNSCNSDSYPNTIEVKNTHAYIWGIEDFVLPNIQSFSFMLLTDSVNFDTTTKTFTGSGYGLEINLSSYTNEYNFPITTQNKSTYPFSNNFYLFEPGKCVANIHRIVDGKSVETIEPDKFDIIFNKKSNWDAAEIRIKTTINDQRTTFIFEGKPTTTDTSYYDLKRDYIEPEVINKEITFDENYVVYDAKTFWFKNSMNTIYVELYSKEYAAFFVCYGFPENREDVYGTYLISQEHTIGTAAQSPGANTAFGNEDAFPSFVARWNEGTDKEEFFLIKEGSVTIKENKIQFDIKTQNGSKIKGESSGELSIERDIIYYSHDLDSKNLERTKQKRKLENNIANLLKR